MSVEGISVRSRESTIWRARRNFFFNSFALESPVSAPPGPAFVPRQDPLRPCPPKGGREEENSARRRGEKSPARGLPVARDRARGGGGGARPKTWERAKGSGQQQSKKDASCSTPAGSRVPSMRGPPRRGRGTGGRSASSLKGLRAWSGDLETRRGVFFAFFF